MGGSDPSRIYAAILFLQLILIIEKLSLLALTSTQAIFFLWISEVKTQFLIEFQNSVLLGKYLFCFACKQNKLLWDQYIIGWFFICIQLNILKKMLEVHFPMIWKPIIKHFPLILPAMGALGRDTKLSKH